MKKAAFLLAATLALFGCTATTSGQSTNSASAAQGRAAAVHPAVLWAGAAEAEGAVGARDPDKVVLHSARVHARRASCSPSGGVGARARVSAGARARARAGAGWAAHPSRPRRRVG